MKKSFFKKLSFVMAAAMTMSLVTPAAGAFAATAPKLNSTKKYLFVGVEDKEDYNFNITSTKGKGWSYLWESSDEDVAVVDEKNGVTTAVGVGTAKITVTITNKAGDEVGEAKATVIVKDNIKELTITNKPEKDTLAVGVPNDFNRSFVTVSGNTKVTSAITRWTVEPAEGATINDKGVFTADKAGEYTVKAMAFQSKAKYETWKADPAANAALVLDTDETKVTVGVSIKGVKLVTPKQMEITFDSSVKDKVDGIDDVKVERKLNDTYTAIVPVWKFDSISEDGKTVTVSTYDDLADKQTYKVNAAGASFDLYVQLGTPVSISMEDQVIPAGTATALSYTLLDQYGVNVASLYDSNVVKNSTVALVNGQLTLINNEVSFVEYNYTIINSDGTVKTLSTGTKTVRGQAASVNAAVEWNIVASEDFSKTNQKIKVGESGLTIFGRQKLSNNGYTSTANYRFESLNTNLIIDTYTNALTPVSAGTALVKVTDINNNNAIVGYINVEVLAEAKPQSAKASTTLVKLSNNISGTAETAYVTVKEVDQYGTETTVALDAAKSFVLNSNKTTDLANVALNVGPNGAANGSVQITAVATKTGSFNYKVTTANGKEVTLTVTVLAPGVLSAYTIDATHATIDTYAANPDTDNATTFSVYGVDAAGTKMIKVVSAAGISYSVKDSEGNAVAAAAINYANVATTGEVTLTLDDTAGTFKTGTYSFSININGIVYTKAITVTNSRPAPALTIKALSAKVGNNTGVIAAVASMIELKINNNLATIATVDYVTSNSNIIASSTNGTGVNFSNTDGTVTIYVKKVTTTNGGITQEVEINRNFTVTVE